MADLKSKIKAASMYSKKVQHLTLKPLLIFSKFQITYFENLLCSNMRVNCWKRPNKKLARLFQEAPLQPKFLSWW